MLTLQKKQEISQELNRYMADSDLSIADLSEFSGVNKSYLQQILQGKKEYYNADDNNRCAYSTIKPYLPIPQKSFRGLAIRDGNAVLVLRHYT